jgi:hypothetical protein
MIHDDLGLMRPIVGLGTTDWSRSAGIDSELEPQDRVPCTILVKTVPPILNDSADGRSDGRVDSIPNAKALLKFHRVASRLEVPKVSTGDGKRRRGTAERSTILREQK